MPRMRPCAGSFKPRSEMKDKDLAQLICAFRLFLPDVGLVLSTRESPQLRNGLIQIGITMHGASHVIKSTEEKWAPIFDISEASGVENTKIRIFGKPCAKSGRRMGVVLATADSTDVARHNAEKAAHLVKLL